MPDLQPGKKPGHLGTVNGFGTRMMGRRDFDSDTGTYVVTHVFVALLIPIWALGAYRVADAPGGGWYCLGRVSLSQQSAGGGTSFWWSRAPVHRSAPVWWNQYTKSPEYVAAQTLKRADEAAAAGRGGGGGRG